MIDHLLIALEITYRSWEIILWRQSQALNVLLWCQVSSLHAPGNDSGKIRARYALGPAITDV